MLSPEQFSEFSAIYIHHITTSFKYSSANFVYHTCGNTMHLAEKMACAGVHGVSLDSNGCWRGPPRSCQTIAPGRRGDREHQPRDNHAVCEPDRGRARTLVSFLKEMERFPNFVLSTGCDLPQETPPQNISAFMAAGRAW